MPYKYKNNPDYDKVRLSVYIPRKLSERLQDMSARNGVPMNHIYNIALIEFFSKIENSSLAEKQ